ncbi:uncharacterized protein BJ171DRAFT_489766 [Polychytrium aggregatum]|uniref:uncharacterized protein n=1 Tax=Polychytrium aggregatum TaxID=110093 RepID=UPI0022FF36D5|nr:uncharacterized protein BJ171DRAFT_489766 [Polychytrium aggregatum]KAI9208724.1 hypothetical protein BJ171DRAFT_489766 [Polychytrium aggregatum]
MSSKASGAKRPSRPPSSASASSSSSSQDSQNTVARADQGGLVLRKLQAALLKHTSPEQSLLNCIREACAPTLSSPDFEAKIRKIKQLFFVRDFGGIFNDPELVPAYSAEYIPGRALCYRELFTAHDELRQVLLKDQGHVFALGAGAGSELVGLVSAMLGIDKFATYMQKRTAASAAADEIPGSEAEKRKLPRLTLHLQDIADYSCVLQPLEAAMRTHYRLPETRLTIESSVFDILDESPEAKALLLAHLSKATLVTAMFILNELLANNKKDCVRLVTQLVRETAVGSLLLVVDSAGSFSEVKVGQGNYMIYHLLDSIQGLEVVLKADSQWYRFPEDLNYPLRLNNMRYFLRLYRRV